MFKFGDKVEIIAPECVPNGTIGVIEDADKYAEYGTTYQVSWKEGKNTCTGWYGEKNLKSVAQIKEPKNNEKFKKGDIVRVKNVIYSTYDKKGKIADFDAQLETAPYFIIFEDGIGAHFSERDLELADEFKNEETSTAQIKDSGNRREFETGAVRDIQEGKGRCDLMPLDVVGYLVTNEESKRAIFKCIHEFKNTGLGVYLFSAVETFCETYFNSVYDAMLDLAKHFEQGALKYGENNWQKGIPTHCYIDSAVRHYLKFMRGDNDEPHDRAFIWNLVCCIWTCENKPELNDYGKGDSYEKS